MGESKFLKKLYRLTSGSCLFTNIPNLYIMNAIIVIKTNRDVTAPGVVLNELSPLYVRPICAPYISSSLNLEFKRYPLHHLFFLSFLSSFLSYDPERTLFGKHSSSVKFLPLRLENIDYRGDYTEEASFISIIQI